MANGRSPGIDPTSAVLGGTALLVTLSALATLATKKEPSPAYAVALPLSVFTWIAYDRWHDGLWPFTNLERQKAFGY